MKSIPYQSDAPKSQDVVINEVMETIIMTNNSHTDRTEPVQKAADEEYLLSFLDQYSNLMLSTSD